MTRLARRPLLGLLARIVLVATVVAAGTLAGPAAPARAATRATAVAVGGDHTCAILADRTVRCWGAGELGQLGGGAPVPYSSTPVAVVGVRGATAIAAGLDHTCALLSTGRIRCWGGNGEGQLGNGKAGRVAATAVGVTGITSATRIAAGDRHTCAILKDGTVRCWGSNGDGQLGSPRTRGFSRTPVGALGIGNASSIAAGAVHTCVRLASGTGRCWGGNRYGQLGRATPGKLVSTVGVFVTAARTLGTLTAGAETTCSLGSDRSVRCWGLNAFGALGATSDLLTSVTALKTTRLPRALAIDAGSGATCAILSDRTVRCWGANDFGILGDGTTADHLVPRAVVGVAGATAISVGRASACAVAAGAVRCWGRNAYGQLGDGATADSAVAVTVRF